MNFSLVDGKLIMTNAVDSLPQKAKISFYKETSF